MRTMNDPEAFVAIHKDNPEFLRKAAESNMALRTFVASYGFFCNRELAKKLIDMTLPQ
tara:strand:- start:3559 stop:3732 length:174 start_codon:yes stop_codon:yes gene_type:complete